MRKEIRRWSSRGSNRSRSRLYLILGLIVGAIVTVAVMAGGLASRAGSGSGGIGSGGIGMVMGAASIIIFPLLYGCFGFVASLIGAWLYNVVAGLVGGIEIETR
jgi:hypothetical protein